MLCECKRSCPSSTAHKDWVVSAACLEGFLFTGSRDTMIKVWDVDNLSLLQTIPAHDGAVSTIAVVRGSMIVSGGSEGSIKVWG